MNKAEDESRGQTAKRGRPGISAAKKRQMRRKIAQSAQQLFQTEGYSRVSMRRIASDIGCSPMSLYNYYDSKVDLLRTLWADVFEDVFEVLAGVQGSDLEPSERLDLLALAYVGYWLDHTDHYRLVFMAEGVTQPEVATFLEHPEIVARYQVFAAAIVEVTGAITDEQLKRKLDGLICFLHGIAHSLITISGYEWSSPTSLVDCALRGVLKA